MASRAGGRTIGVPLDSALYKLPQPLVVGFLLDVQGHITRSAFKIAIHQNYKMPGVSMFISSLLASSSSFIHSIIHSFIQYQWFGCLLRFISSPKPEYTK